MPRNFDIDVATGSDELAVTLSGELDISARDAVVGAVTRPMATAHVSKLAIDVGEVTFCDSSGLGALLDIRQAADEAGVHMVLRNIPPPVARLLDLTDVDGWLARE